MHVTRTTFLALALVATATLSCTQCGVDPPLPCPRDANNNPILCTSDAQCQDGNFCDGREACQPGAASANDCGCLYAEPATPCRAGEECLEESGQCVAVCVDMDFDGHTALRCGGDDCDDEDANRYPGNVEVCDADDHDEDCNWETYGVMDGDRDGYGSARCCNEDPERGSFCGNDCNDGDEGQHPAMVEVCNGLDDNCDDQIDEHITVAMYEDEDGDGNGAGAAMQLCPGWPGYSALGNDCDDTNAALLPGAMRCTGVGLPAIEICGSDGAWVETSCGANQNCIAQPNGTGLCR
jgi:hypothetical protein